MKRFQHQIAGIIGNILENYDKALFGLLAPFIAPLFFYEEDPITSLILTYAILPLGALMRPVGSCVFGWIGDNAGRKEALFYSLLGMAFVTVAMGFLPTAAVAGGCAPIFLALLRMLQSFFAAGEGPGGAIYVLEHTSDKRKSVADGFYGASSIVGILIASLLITLLSSYDLVKSHWRYLFWLGGLTGFVGLYLRAISQNSPTNTPLVKSIGRILQLEKEALFRISLASGFSYVTYSLSFTLMNGLIPLITSCTATEVMQANSALLVVDMCALPCFGLLAMKIGKERLMKAAALLLFFAAIPLFMLLPNASMFYIIFVRLVIVLCGVAFCAPYHAWAIEQVAVEHRYTVLSVGASIGALLIGTPSSAICLWLYTSTNWAVAPAFYLMFSAIIAIIALYGIFTRKQIPNNLFRTFT